MLLLILNLWRYIMDGFTKVGQKIKYYREEKGISIESLAKLSEVSTDKLRQIEVGEIVYQFSTLLKIASALQVELPDLLDFE